MCRTLIYYRCICRFNQYSRHGYQRTTTHEKCYFARRSIVFRHNISYQNVEDLVREYLSKKWEKYSSIKMIAKHHLSLIRQNNLPSLLPCHVSFFRITNDWSCPLVLTKCTIAFSTSNFNKKKFNKCSDHFRVQTPPALS